MKRIQKSIGFSGCGNMGSAVLAGILEKRIVCGRQVFVYDPVRSSARAVRSRFGVRIVRSNAELVKKSDIIMLAMKPQDLNAAVASIREARLHKKKIIISILAGTPVKKLKRLLGRRFEIARAMPNLGARVGAAVTAVTGDRAALPVADLVFAGCGKVIRLPEKFFDLVTAVSGSGPAYFFLVMELLARYGARYGLPKRAAELLAVQTALGAAKLAECASDGPAALRHKVTSKRGTTEAALNYLARRKFPELFSQALTKAVRRSRELSRS